MRERNQSGQSTATVAATRTKWDFEPLDKSSFTPMYFQIQTQLLQMIQSGRLRPGDPLPSEEELSRIYGVSRMTSRQALQSLKNQGFVSRHKGQGSFVSQPRVEKDITHLCGFTAEMRALGIKASSRVLESETVSASPETAAQLGIPVGAPVFRLRRLRLADGLPVAVEQIQIPSAHFPGINGMDFSRLSLYQTLRTRYGIRVSRADEILEARAASNREAELLDIQPRASLLVISRTLWSADGLPVETAHSVYRGDRYRAVLRIPATAME
ncbi:MAG TPA: GntR family transcriptional regulator [Acidobacteriaceae bacterium]|jgi:GntR family transcriptional regulator|nr:GntR family transcriptional regulator [Acidobacteriaceae bacterium]